MIQSCVCCLNLVTLVCEGAAHLVRFYVTCNDKMHHDHSHANQKPILCVLEKIECLVHKSPTGLLTLWVGSVDRGGGLLEAKGK